jgi:hypothetical protein
MAPNKSIRAVTVNMPRELFDRLRSHGRKIGNLSVSATIRHLVAAALSTPGQQQ